MARLNPYLTFDGTAEEAFNFYKSLFGGDFKNLQRWSEKPAGDTPLPPDEGNKIMHISLPVEGVDLMGGDSPVGQQTQVGTNYAISIDPKSEQETRELFDKLSHGGKVIMPLEDTFWNALFGMCIDRFGVQWMLNFQKDGNN